MGPAAPTTNQARQSKGSQPIGARPGGTMGCTPGRVHYSAPASDGERHHRFMHHISVSSQVVRSTEVATYLTGEVAK